MRSQKFNLNDLLDCEKRDWLGVKHIFSKIFAYHFKKQASYLMISINAGKFVQGLTNPPTPCPRLHIIVYYICMYLFI